MPTPPSSEPDAPTLDDAETTDLLPVPPWRRPLLLVASGALLGLGVYLNADVFAEPYHAVAAVAQDDAVQERELQVVAEVEMGGTGRRHKGEEGTMGRPSPRAHNGLYAMKGPQNVVPQMARNFEPDLQGREAGILGMIEPDSGHFVASPHGDAMAVGNDDEDVWGGLTGTEVGEAFGVGGLGLVGTGRGGGGIGLAGVLDDERYAKAVHNAFVATAKDHKSTFSIDVDTASYSNTRRFLLREGSLPDPGAVRTEELVNYFDYDYAMPSDGPFSVTTEVGPCPWNMDNRIVHIGIQGKVLDADGVPPRNLVFLVDVSGSMDEPDKLPLVKHGLTALTGQLDARDRISIVVYAGAAGMVLAPTRGDEKEVISRALDRLQAGGSTNGAGGIDLAYRLAEQTFIDGGINRVILATDGDFNVGVSDHDALVELIEAKRKTGVFLSVLGFGTANLNDHMMEQIADKGNGNYAYIDSRLEARKVLVEESGATLHTIAKDVKIQVEFDADQVARHRLIGYENRILAHRDFDDDTKDAGEIGAGHTVTALYEIEPAAGADDDPLMTLNLRYKQPDGDKSRKISTPVRDGGNDLHDTSNDYRFSAAVAAFGQKLRGAEHQEASEFESIYDLAHGALGNDAYCYRHQFLELVRAAGALSGEPVDRPSMAGVCEPSSPEPPRVAKSSILVEARDDEAAASYDDETPTDDDTDWLAFVLQVLRLLPPMLALPLFVMALRRPRARRS